MNKSKKIIFGCIVGLVGLSGTVAGLSVELDKANTQQVSQTTVETKTAASQELQKELSKLEESNSESTRDVKTMSDSLEDIEDAKSEESISEAVRKFKIAKTSFFKKVQELVGTKSSQDDNLSREIVKTLTAILELIKKLEIQYPAVAGDLEEEGVPVNTDEQPEETTKETTKTETLDEPVKQELPDETLVKPTDTGTKTPTTIPQPIYRVTPKETDTGTKTPTTPQPVKIPDVTKTPTETTTETKEETVEDEKVAVDKLLAAKMITMLDFSSSFTRKYRKLELATIDYIQGDITKVETTKAIDTFLKAEAKSLRLYYQRRIDRPNPFPRWAWGFDTYSTEKYKKEVEKLKVLEASERLGEDVVSGDYSFDSLIELFGFYVPRIKAWESLEESNELIDSFMGDTEHCPFF